VIPFRIGPSLSRVSKHKTPLSKASRFAIFHRGKSVSKQGDDEAEVHEYLENCRRTPMHRGERTLTKPGIRLWTPSNDLAQSRRRESRATEVLGRQWDALRPLCCGCQIGIFRPPVMPSLTALVARAGPAGVSP